MNAVVSAKDEFIDELVTHFEKHFWCLVGPPRAYFELAERHHMFRVVYKTYALVSPEDTPMARKNLVETMWTDYFKPGVDALIKENPDRVPADNLLFWRLLPYFAARGEGLELRFRLAIPGVPIGEMAQSEAA